MKNPGASSKQACLPVWTQPSNHILQGNIPAPQTTRTKRLSNEKFVAVQALDAFLTVFDSGPAGFTDFDFPLPRFLFIKNFYIVSFTNRTFTPSAGKKFPNPLTSLRLSHFPFPTYLV
jgi:hypothetical protein